jgi:hypothetical protein
MARAIPLSVERTSGSSVRLPAKLTAASRSLPASWLTRSCLATWLEDGAVPARVIDELMGHQAGRRGEREGGMVGTRYRHMTEAMQARVVAVIAERLTLALAVMPQVCPEPGSGEEAACWGRGRRGG